MTMMMTMIMTMMLTSHLQIKCDQYWPSRGTETYGMTQVTLLDTMELATFCVRTFSLHKVSSHTHTHSTTVGRDVVFSFFFTVSLQLFSLCLCPFSSFFHSPNLSHPQFKCPLSGVCHAPTEQYAFQSTYNAEIMRTDVNSNLNCHSGVGTRLRLKDCS